MARTEPIVEMSPSPPLRGYTPESCEVSITARLLEVLSANGYTHICVRRHYLCAVKQFNFTTAVVVGIDNNVYDRRYCYEHRVDAQAALAAWDGDGHPPGSWIKCKGVGIDLLNPELR